jgi:hypothetical protein
MKIDLLLSPRGQNPLSYYILYNESKHNVLAFVGKANKSGILKFWNSEIRIWNFDKAITNKKTTRTNKQGIENADPLEAGKYLLTLYVCSWSSSRVVVLWSWWLSFRTIDLVIDKCSNVHMTFVSHISTLWVMPYEKWLVKINLINDRSWVE